MKYLTPTVEVIILIITYCFYLTAGFSLIYILANLTTHIYESENRTQNVLTTLGKAHPFTKIGVLGTIGGITIGKKMKIDSSKYIANI